MSTKLWKLNANNEVATPSDFSELESALADINGGSTLPQLNLFVVTSPVVENGQFALDISKNVYRVQASVSNGVATIPTPDATNIPSSSMYYYFELEVSVNSSATSMVGPSGWTWLPDGILPSGQDLQGKTVYISARLDCS